MLDLTDRVGIYERGKVSCRTAGIDAADDPPHDLQTSCLGKLRNDINRTGGKWLAETLLDARNGGPAYRSFHSFIAGDEGDDYLSLDGISCADHGGFTYSG